MNHRMIFYTISRMMLLAAVLLILPLAVSLIYGEACYTAFLWTMGISLILGLPGTLFCKPKKKLIYVKEGFLIVTAAWLLFSVIGALPFVISGEIPNFVDAFFEVVSGLTTTGASILTDVEKMSHGLLFFRSFTHWIGGMGVLVLVMAVLPDLSGRSIHILKAEMPGPIFGKLVPRIKDTAKILYIIYFALTLLEIFLLLLGGMDLFESVTHAFGTAGTGGFGVKADSIASYSPYLQWVITIFMLLFGINFNLFYLLLIGKIRAFFRSAELRVYLGIFVAAVILVTINVLQLYPTFAEALRHSAFQVSSIMTTTGYATTDFNLWPSFSKAILLLLMSIGACAGSTAGGLKVSRVIILFRLIYRELRQLLHPRSVNTIKLDGKQLDETTLRSVSGYFAVYMVTTAIIFLLLSIEPFDLETNLSATFACFNNIGPGFGAVGPASNYAAYSPLSKIALSFAMLMGRLEIFPLVLTFLPGTWKKN